MNIIEKDITELRAYEKNPRHNEKAVDAVAASIREFGFKVPIVIDKENVIAAGHTRVAAARKLGLEKVPCIVADDLTEEQIRAFRLADNKTAELAEWDEDLLAEELKMLDDIDMSEFGFDMSEYDDDKDIEEVDFEDNPEEEPTAKLGQIYQLGEHRLMCGDSTDPKDVEKLMGGQVADMMVTDPPYNVNYESTAGKIKNDNLRDEEFLQFLQKAMKCASDSLKSGGAYYVWYATAESRNFQNACISQSLAVKQVLIWVKNQFVLGRQDYQWIYEPCLYGWKEGAAHYFINNRSETTVLEEPQDFKKMKKEELVELLEKLFDTTDVIRENKPSKSELHPTMKPVALFARLIRNSSKKGEIVLDLFGGSGTTMMACEQLGRKAYLMEYDPHYADVIIKRWEEYTGKKAELISE